MKIQEKEAKVMLRRAIRSMGGDIGDFVDRYRQEGPDQEELLQKAVGWLSNEDTVMNKKFPSQAWRIDRGTAMVREQINQDWQKHKTAGDTTGDMNTTAGDIAAKAPDERKAGNVGVTQRNMVRDFLQGLNDQLEIGVPDDADWEDIITQCIHDIAAATPPGGKPPSGRDVAQIGARILQIHAQSVAARSPAQHKIDPAAKEPMEVVLHFLKRLPEARSVPEDVNWKQITSRFIAGLQETSQTRGRRLNNLETYLVARDLIRSI